MTINSKTIKTEIEQEKLRIFFYNVFGGVK